MLHSPTSTLIYKRSMEMQLNIPGGAVQGQQVLDFGVQPACSSSPSESQGLAENFAPFVSVTRLLV